MADEAGRCRCGNEYVCVIERASGTTVYCPECGRQTTRLARESAIRAWNERAKERGRRRKQNDRALTNEEIKDA